MVWAARLRNFSRFSLNDSLSEGKIDRTKEETDWGQDQNPASKEMGTAISETGWNKIIRLYGPLDP